MRNDTPTERLNQGLERKPNGCLTWAGYTDADGYGRISVDGKMVGTHRFAWELVNGPIPAGRHVCHHCDNPPCAQTEPTEGFPDGHLFLGTEADNATDKVAKGRWRGNGNENKTHCPDNHAYDEANTYVDKRGIRTCRACNRAAVARYKQSKKAS